MMRIVIYFTALVILAGCNDPSGEYLSINYDNQDALFTDFVRYFDFTEAGMDTFIQDIEYIYLESKEDSYLDRISKLVLTNEYLFVGVFYENSGIYVFTRDGNFVTSISDFGNGPGEVSHITDYAVDEVNQQIYVGEGGNRRISVFGFDGNFVRAVQTGFSFYKMAYDPNMQQYIFYTPHDQDRQSGSRIKITDGSAEKLEALRLEHPRLRVIHLTRNFGQQGAMLAGIAETRGALLVTMDVDLQHPAETIPEMIRKWEQGVDVVYALPAQQGRNQLKPADGQLTLFKSYTSRIYQSLISRLQEPGHTYVSTDFRLFDQEVAEVIRRLPEKNLYLRNVFAWLCPVSMDSLSYSSADSQSIFRSACIPYRLGRRQHGDTKYTSGQLIRLAIYGLTNGGIRPLRMGVLAGAIALVLSVILLVMLILYHGITWSVWSGWEILLLAGLFFGSIQLMLLCLIGEYTGKIFLQNQGRPPYLHRNPVRENKRKKWSVNKGSVPLSLQKE